MNRTFTIGLGMLVTGAAIGAAAVQTLHAQAKPPAFQIVEVTVDAPDPRDERDLAEVSIVPRSAATVRAVLVGRARDLVQLQSRPRG